MLEFEKIFRKREYDELVGDSRRDLYVLTIILFVTFAALAHIFGGQKELKLRMANPFSNWVNIPVSNVSGENIPKMVKELENPDLLDSFEILDAKYYQINWLKALKKSLDKTRKIRLRSVDFGSPVSGAILSETNVIHECVNGMGDCTIIVTEEVLQDLEYFDYQDSMFLPVYENSYDEYKLTLLLPISHIVKELPDNVDMVVSSTFMSLLNSNVQKSNFLNQNNSRIISFFADSRIKQEDILPHIPDSIEISDVKYLDFHVNGKDYVKHQVKLYTRLHFLEILEIQRNMVQFEYYSYIDFFCNESVEYDIHEHYYALNFKNLSKIKEFRDFAKNEYDINISLAQVESKDNFYLISRLAKLFIYLLIGFAMFSIIIFLQSIIKNHLDKIKPILGTLKAFGLKDQKIRSLYLHVIFKFYNMASLIAFSIMILYYVTQLCLKATLFYDVFNFKLLIIWIALSLLLFIFFYRYTAKVLFKSPGDLVYNR